MKKDTKVFLSHILESIEKIDEFTVNVDREEFMEDSKTQYSVIRGIEIIGEATKNIPESFRKKHSGVPWAEMARTRDKLIHGYFGVDLELTWDILKEDLPDLKKKIKKILEDMETISE